MLLFKSHARDVDDGMFFEFRVIAGGTVGTIMSASAFRAGQGRACNQQRRHMNIPGLAGAPRYGFGQTFAGFYGNLVAAVGRLAVRGAPALGPRAAVRAPGAHAPTRPRIPRRVVRARDGIAAPRRGGPSNEAPRRR